MQADKIDLKEVMPLFSPVYDPEYLEDSQKLLKFIKDKKFDSESNELAQIILDDDQGDYNAWYVKKMFILSQNRSEEFLEKEQDFVDECLKVKVKGFQVWEQKRFLTELGYDFRKELIKTEAVLVQKDQKNYHAWSYRVWLTNFGKIHQGELKFAEKMIKKDPYNNSAWSYLYFTLENTIQLNEAQKQGKQLLSHYVNYAIQSLKKHPSNKAGWNFVRGLFPSIKLKSFSNQNTIKKTLSNSYDEYPQIYQYCQQQWKEAQSASSKTRGEVELAAQLEILATLVHIHSHKEESLVYAKNICEQLKEKEALRKYYWSWVQLNLE